MPQPVSEPQCPPHPVRTLAPTFAGAPVVASNAWYRKFSDVASWQPAESLPLLSEPGFLVGGREYFGALFSRLDQLIANAYHHGPRGAFICVAGWMMSPEIILSPNPHAGGTGHTLAFLLSQASQAGIEVCVLLWADSTKTAGTNADCVRTHFCSEMTGMGKVLLGEADRHRTILGNNPWSSHQKHVTIYDPFAPGPDCLVSFVGGIDLCVGRYDDERKVVFASEDPGNEFHSHLYNSFASTPLAPAAWVNGSPRLPWHDLQVLVGGQVSVRLLQVFLYYWTHNDGETPQFAGSIPSISQHVDRLPPSRCRVQLYHTAGSTEPSMHHAWVAGIQSAERLIYIEQQFFQGFAGEYGEKDGFSRVGCHNLIPWAVADRIQRAQAASVPFHVYVVCPIVPEPEQSDLAGGITPAALAKRAMLRFHHDTRKFLQKRVGPSWQQYVSFLYLVERRGHDEHPIYVHAKTMIIDDIVCFVGSANVNDRSMRGDGDAETCVVIEDTHLRSCVGELRRKLMSQHSGLPTNCHVITDPVSPAAIGTINSGNCGRFRPFPSEPPKQETRPKGVLSSLADVVGSAVGITRARAVASCAYFRNLALDGGPIGVALMTYGAAGLTVAS